MVNILFFASFTRKHMLCWGPDWAHLLSQPWGMWLRVSSFDLTAISNYTQNISEPPSQAFF